MSSQKSYTDGKILAAATLTGFFFRHWELHETNVVVVYIFSVLLISRFITTKVKQIATSARERKMEV